LAKSSVSSLWNYSKGAFGRKAAIVQKQLHKNISLLTKNAPSTIIKLKEE